MRLHEMCATLIGGRQRSERDSGREIGGGGPGLVGAYGRGVPGAGRTNRKVSP